MCFSSRFLLIAAIFDIICLNLVFLSISMVAEQLRRSKTEIEHQDEAVSHVSDLGLESGLYLQQMQVAEKLTNQKLSVLL